ncbi:MAG: T9SS type A sorting domain-containing protein, partial [Crocinitomicaceae bacterium]|nr:T9SS type A sorting domain-containing protein [Crocinitomicaceae bacterium]
LEDLVEGNGIMPIANDTSGCIFYWDSDLGEWMAPATKKDTFKIGVAYNVFIGKNPVNGVTYVSPTPNIVSLQGPLAAAADKAVEVGYNSGQYDTGFVGNGTLQETEGWNLIGNPFTTTYDFQGQGLPSGMSNSIAIWNANDGTGKYAYYSSGGGVNGGTQYIAPFQGFFVQTTNASSSDFVFRKSQRTVLASPNLFKNGNNKVRLTYENTVSRYSDELLVEIEPMSTDSFEMEFDSRKLRNGKGMPNFFSYVDKQQLAIQRAAEFEGVKSFQLGIVDTESNMMKVSPNLDELDEDWIAVLEDTKNGERQILENHKKYKYEFDARLDKDRFILHLITARSEFWRLDDPQSKIKVWVHEELIRVFLSESKMAKVTLINSAGKEVIIYQLKGERGVNDLIIPKVSTGIYYVQVQTAQETITEKVIINQQF